MKSVRLSSQKIFTFKILKLIFLRILPRKKIFHFYIFEKLRRLAFLSYQIRIYSSACGRRNMGLLSVLTDASFGEDKMAAKPDAEPDPIVKPSTSGLETPDSVDEMPENISNVKKKNRDPSMVGVDCETAGITLEVLQKGWKSSEQRSKGLTEMMVAEIEYYRQRYIKLYTYKDVREWLSRLLGPEAYEGVGDSTFQSHIRGFWTRAKKLKSDRKVKGNEEKLQEMRTKKYQPPGHRPERAEPQPSSSGTSAMLQSAKRQKQCLEKELKEKDKEVKQLVLEKFAVEKEVQKMKRKREKEDSQLAKKKRVLLDQEAKMKKKASKLNLKSWKDRVKRRDLKSMQSQEEIAHLVEKCSNLQTKVEKLTKQRESQRVRLQYYKKKKAKMQEELTVLKKNDKARDKEMSALIAQVEDLTTQLEDGEKSIDLREGPHKNSPFKDEVRLTYMKLLSFNVSSRIVTPVVHAVLTTLVGFNTQLEDLPGHTFSQLIREEKNIVSTIHATENLENANLATLHSDGTSRDGKKVVGFQANTAKLRTETLGVPQVPSGESADQLDAFKFILDKMASLTSTPENKVQKSKELLAKFKNTMADGASSQKMFNRLVEAYRAEVLPDVIQNWSELDGPTKEKMATMNHMYCNLHALIGFATYADEALHKLEGVWRKLKGSPLGVESLKEFQDKDGNYSWSHADSATQRLIRTACEAFCPNGNQQAGRILEFQLYLNVRHQMKRDTRMHSFVANRFNILFECAAGVYYHSSHLRTMFEEGYVKAANKLLRAVLADLTCEPLLAGCRALGIIYVHITEPYWRLVERVDVHILDLTKSLQAVLVLFEQWSRDATPLLQPDLPPIFSTPTGPLTPIQDEIFTSLYAETSEEMAYLTKQALELMMSNISVVIKRRFKDQTALANSDDPTLRAQTADMNKSNRRGENDFGYWAYLQKDKPSLGGMAAEGQLMFKFNCTAAWLDALVTEDPVKYKAILRQARRQRAEWHKAYKDRTGALRERQEVKLRDSAEQHEAKLRKNEEALQAQRNLLQKHGGPVSAKTTCSEFLKHIESLPDRTQNNILRKQIQYSKAMNAELAKSHKQLFVLSSNGHPHDTPQLRANLQAIVSSQGFIPDTDPGTEPPPQRPAAPTFSKEDAEDEIDRIKAQFTAKVVQVPDVRETVNAAEKRNDKENETAGLSDEREEERESDGEESGEEEGDSDGEEERESDGEESGEEEGDSDGEESEEVESDDDESEKEVSEHPIAVGSIVVVAYEDDWAVGEVTKLENSEFSVSFMTRTRKELGVHVFYWPDRPTTYPVERKFILTTLTADRLKLKDVSNTRKALIRIEGWEDIQMEYTCYYNRYFARRQPRAAKRQAAKPRAKKSS
ncbi:uncharacterized protein LOC118429173 [Branchiostoma floridae]|uniref:Uncharacterized protein LOC118429173 n=1 Tax=Branchiostoma floridae TaxID=7739 RepID=A0A9J7N8W6_BRAFL|nr:uncharacterized protein LOC118429173 [Branchiostoma floridae]